MQVNARIELASREELILMLSKSHVLTPTLIDL